MPSTYTVNLGIEKPATGEQSGTWGDTVNDNSNILDEAINGVVSITLASAGSSGSPNSITITDGASSTGRNKWIEFADGGDLGAAAYVQLTPNDAEKICFIRNSLTASRSIFLFQGTYNASNDLEIAAGTDVVVKFNGGGTGATVVNVYANLKVDGIVATTADINGGTVDGTVIGGAAAAALTATTVVANTSLNIAGTTTISSVLDEDNMASDSATALATQQSIKAYVDSQVGTVDTLSEILANGNTTGATDIDVDGAQKVQFRDAAIYINSSVDGQLDIVADTEIQIAATTVDLNGNLDVSGTALVTGVLTTSIKYSHSSDAMLFSTAGTSRLNIASNGDISFYEDTGTTPKFFWDASAESLGIGITAPVRPLHVQVANNGGSVSTAIFENSASLAGSQSEIILVSGGNTSRGASISSYNESATGQPASMLFSTSAAYATPTERMRIDSSGNVGIGTSSPIYTSATRTTTTINGTASANLSFGVNGTGYGNIYADSASFELGSTTNSNPVKFTIGGTERMRIDASGNVVVGDTSAQASNAATLMADGEVTAAGFYFSNNIGAAMNDTGIRRATTSSMVFDTASTERMRIDASGRVGIGTSPDFPLHVSSTGVVLGLNATSGAVSQRFNENGTARFFLSTLNGSNGLAFVNGDGTSERMRIDSSGNLGLGMAPTTNNISKSISLVNGGSIFGYGSGTYITANSNYNGAFNTVATGPDSKMLLDGNVIFSRSASASAGTAGAETESMRITSAGLVGIGGNGTGNGLGVYLSRGTGANFFEASDGTKTMITGTDSTQDFVKIGSLSAHPVGFVIGCASTHRVICWWVRLQQHLAQRALKQVQAAVCGLHVLVFPLPLLIA
jgi:hypothetical protein